MLAVLTAIWKRPEVTRVMLRHYARMKTRRRLKLVAVGSEGEESRRLAEENGWEYVEAPNDPLSDKLAAGVQRVRELGPARGMVAMGSDDLVTERWLEICSNASIRAGLKDMFILHRRTWNCVHWPGYIGRRAGESVGAHRFFPRRMLERLDWKMWPPGLNRNLDGNLTARIKQLDPPEPSHVVSMAEARVAALGISCDVNITSWRAASRGTRKAPVEHVLSQFPRDTVMDIMSLHPVTGSRS